MPTFLLSSFGASLERFCMFAKGTQEARWRPSFAAVTLSLKAWGASDHHQLLWASVCGVWSLKPKAYNLIKTTQKFKSWKCKSVAETCSLETKRLKLIVSSFNTVKHLLSQLCLQNLLTFQFSRRNTARRTWKKFSVFCSSRR